MSDMAGAQKVLIAEDDKFLSSLLKARLEKEGFDVKLASDGEEAIRLLHEFNPSVFVLDLIMPRVSGFEVLEAVSIEPRYNKMPIIVLSNLGQESDVEKAREFGVAEYFIKARTSVDELVHTVKNLIGAPVPA